MYSRFSFGEVGYFVGSTVGNLVLTVTREFIEKYGRQVVRLVSLICL